MGQAPAWPLTARTQRWELHYNGAMRFRAFFLLPLIAAWAAGVALQGAPDSKPVPAHLQKKFDPKRDAAKDITDTVVLAKKENKRILLDVGGEWCGWCKKLDKFFEENLEAKAILAKSYLVVKINMSPENENKELLSKFPKIKGYPHLFVLDKDGKLLHSQDTGELETDPNHDPAKVIPFLQKWANK
jgi:thiol-disulfide isomerase/thioredoxin